MSANRDREEEIFDTARELAADERAAYLAERCGQDADLRQRIEGMLEADAAAGEFFKTHDAPSPTVILADASLSPSIEKPGDRIGRYKLLQQIGEGGMGLVYMAEQDQPVRRSVALKIIKLGMDTRQVVARFEAERQALAMMNHPHIAKVFDAGATDSGRPYFVMELVRGIPMTEYCDKNCLPTRQRLELFILVCQAVQHAHQKGVIHRDLKPSNILVTLNDGVPWPMIIDFGIAKATNQRLTEKTLFTHFAQMIGTPAYMSPEQAEMSKLDVDTRTDIYALGVLLYELLTGTTPFSTRELLSLGYREMQRTIAEREPLRLSTRLSTMANEERTVVAKNRSVDVTALAKLFRGDLDWIAMKCLEKDRARRYETANGLAADIQRHLSSEPIRARPPSNLYRFQKSIQRNKLAFAATGAVTAALAIGLGVSTWMFFRENQARQRAVVAEKSQTQLRLQAEADEKKAKTEADRARLAELSAETERQGAEKQRALAEDRAQQIAHNLYASHMNVAFHAWDMGDISRVLGLLNEHRPKPGEEDMRGFEWFYLWRLCHTEQLTLLGHNAQMRCVIFSPDGRLVATGGDDSLARLWDAQTGREMVTLRGHTNWVTSAAFAPDGKTLATGSGDQTVRLWDTVTGKELAALLGHTQAVTALAFSPDGKLLASATGKLPTGSGNPYTRFVDIAENKSTNSVDRVSSHDVVKLWQIEDRKEIRTLTGHTRAILSLAISPDGKTLATGGADRTMKLWEMTTGEVITNVTGFRAPIFAVAFSPNGQILASAGGDPYSKQTELRLWDVSSAKEVMDFRAHSGPVFSLAFAPDGETLATGGMDQLVRFWQVSSGNELRSIKGHTASIWSVAFAPGGKRLATASWDKTVKIWDATAQQALEVLPRAGDYSVSFSPDGKFLVTGMARELKVFEVGSDKPPFIIPDSRNGDPIEAFSPDGTILASAGSDKAVTFWEVGTWRRLLTLKGHTDKIWSLAFSPDGKTLATGSGDKTLRLWNVAERRERGLIRAHTSTVCSMAFTPDGKTLIAGSWNEILLLDPSTGDVRTKIAESGPRLAISPDGRFLAVSRSASAGVKLMDLATEETKWQIKPHQDSLWSLTFSPDGKTLATGSWDGTAKLWNAASGQEMFTYKASGVVWSVAFSPDGNWFTVGSSPDGCALFHCANAAEVEADWQARAKLAPAAPLVTPKPILSTSAQLAARLPSRDPRAGPELLDLTASYNAALTDGWSDGNAENNLTALPRGLQTFAGVEFDVRGLVQLRCSKSFTEPFPKEIKNIRVGRDCRKLHFLHAASTSWGTTNGAIIGQFFIHQSGLSAAEMPIRFGSDVRDWWVHPKQQPAGKDSATIAWASTNVLGQPLQLFKTTWENPRPDVKVESLDYASSMSTAAPFLIAITLE